MADNKIKISKNIPVESYITASILAGALLVGVFTPIERIPVIGGMAESLGMQQAELGRSFASLTAESFSFKQTGNIAKGETTKEVLKTNEFLNLTNYFSSKINSPYEEIKYVIKNNDSIEKILKNYNIKNEDIKEISVKLKEKKLSNIYSGKGRIEEGWALQYIFTF